MKPFTALLLIFFAFVAPAFAAEVPLPRPKPILDASELLKGSRFAVLRAHNVAHEHEYTFMRNAKHVERFAALDLLVPVKASEHILLHNVSYPLARPVLSQFIEQLSLQYFKACGEKLVVTSLMRPKNRQPRNASKLSVHPAGIAADLGVPRGKCRQWLERELLALEKGGVGDVTLERRPLHYHFVLFPNEYIASLDERETRPVPIPRPRPKGEMLAQSGI